MSQHAQRAAGDYSQSSRPSWAESLTTLTGAWYCSIAGLWAPLLLSLGYLPQDREFLVLCGVTLLPALLAAGISRSSHALSALLAALMLFVFLDLYLIDVVDAVIGIIDFSVMVILCWLLRARIVPVLGAGSLAFTISVALTAQPLDPAGWSTTPTAASRLNLPPVIHLILDEHCGTDCIPPEIMTDDERAAARQAYVDRDFAVWSGVRSTDMFTRFSLTTMMNPGSGSPAQFLTRHSPGFESAQTKNAYLERMTGAGYRIRVLQTSFLNFCPPTLSEKIECRTYQHNAAGVLRFLDLDPIERLMLLAGLIDWSLRYGHDTILYRELLDTRLGAVIGDWRATGARRRLQPLVAQRALSRVASDLKEAGPGDLYVAHLLVPHHPYVFGENCEILPVEQWVDLHVPSPITSESTRMSRYARYKAQVACTDRIVTNLLDGLAANDRLRNAIIVLHGDHGSRIGPTLFSRIGPHYEQSDHDGDFYSVFFAVRAPGQEPGVKISDMRLSAAFWSVIGPIAGTQSD